MILILFFLFLVVLSLLFFSFYLKSEEERKIIDEITKLSTLTKDGSLIFKSNNEAFRVACKYHKYPFNLNNAQLGIVKSNNDMSPILTKDHKGRQVAMINMASDTNEIYIKSKTISSGGPEIKEGDLVLLKYTEPLEELDNLEVNLIKNELHIVAILSPEYNYESNQWKIKFRWEKENNAKTQNFNSQSPSPPLKTLYWKNNQAAFEIICKFYDNTIEIGKAMNCIVKPLNDADPLVTKMPNGTQTATLQIPTDKGMLFTIAVTLGAGGPNLKENDLVLWVPLKKIKIQKKSLGNYNFSNFAGIIVATLNPECSIKTGSFTIKYKWENSIIINNNQDNRDGLTHNADENTDKYRSNLINSLENETNEILTFIYTETMCRMMIAVIIIDEKSNEFITHEQIKKIKESIYKLTNAELDDAYLNHLISSFKEWEAEFPGNLFKISTIFTYEERIELIKSMNLIIETNNNYSDKQISLLFLFGKFLSLLEKDVKSIFDKL